MPSVCVKCDGCGKELTVQTKFKGQARATSRLMGWSGTPMAIGELADPNTDDYCPACTARRS